MTATQHSNTLDQIAGQNIADICRQFGTPCYVYDARTIRDRVSELAQFDVIRFAQKACSNLAILDLMRKLGVVIDAVSAGEILRGFAAGFSAHDPIGNSEQTMSVPPIVYTADIFDRDALDLIHEHGLHVNVGSADMIEQLAERCPGANITIRINPGFGHGHSQKTNTGGPQSKHGIWHDQLESAARLAEDNGLCVSGLHMHIGSGTDFQHLSQVCDAMLDAARRVGRSVTTISAGGGLPTPYKPGDRRVDIQKYFELWDDTRNKLQDEFGHALKLEIEPGRYLVAESGFLVCEIRAIKTMGDNLFYLVDAGFNNLARPILYGAYHPISIASKSGSSSTEQVEVVVGGPLCESGDIFTQEDGGFVVSRKLPVAQVGDFLVIHCAGAYGACMGSNYNSKPLAAEVLIDDGNVNLIRKRQKLEAIFADEMIPTA
jgi:diaminopimelate decarboxylase